MMCYMGYKFGGGDTPNELQILVNATSYCYNLIMPFITDTLIPLMIPALKAIAIPMKVAASKLLNLVLQKVRDPETQKQAIGMLDQATKAAAAAANGAAGTGGDL